MGLVVDKAVTADTGQPTVAQAVPAIVTQPLSVANFPNCSEFGFCGTTADFCGKNCQSNCVEHPKPSGGGGKVDDRVIGYWEAWNARSTCHNTQASDLPLDALTHVNYAFAYIDPSSFEITTMDAQTPVSTFEDVVALKDLKPDLKVFVSIGGWTFSDNDTATQPVFGNIARTSDNRQKFANNLLKFMTGYGFDGVDLDWEYPGAPDRGGKEDDTKNYVELLKTLKSTFRNSGQNLGLTFTAPSSFWYLRWFDLPGMMKHADWVNLMSYDLHGVWDSSNPIGAIVQAHTNLTEIQLAAELFWRVKIPPSQVALGFGFYGRAFTLSDPSCTKPGCPFSGGAKKGACTATSGYLAHYEIQDILNKNKKRDLTVVHDEKAAVKYLHWDNNQWISFDDADTFKQKKEWANSVGFSGSLIWASDLDDYDNTAHKAFTGNQKIGSRKQLSDFNLKDDYTETANSFLGQGCKFNETVVSDVKSYDCGKDMELVAYDTHGCKGDKNHKDWQCGWPMCCPTSARMKDKCMWRGSGGDCNGQCHANEVKIGGSSWGGYPGEGHTGRCSRGGKALCCTVDTEPVTHGCYWTKGCDNKKCKADEESVAHAFSINDNNECLVELPPLKRRGDELFSLQSRASSGGQNYCCKKTKKAFDKCSWVGSGDCAKNTCERNQITLATDPYGDSDTNCNWWRSKALCCEPDEDALNVSICDGDLCEDGGCDIPELDDSLTKRSLSDDWDYLEGRATKRPPGAANQKTIVLEAGINLILTSAPYPSGAKIFEGGGVSTLAMKGGFMMADTVCTNLGVKFHTLSSIEHLLKVAVTGVLVSKKAMKAAKMSAKDVAAAWNAVYPAGATLKWLGEQVVANVPGFGSDDGFGNDWNNLKTPNMRFFTVIGSHAYRYGLSYLPGDMNTMKSNLLRGLDPVALGKFTKRLNKVVAKGTSLKDMEEAVTFLLTGIQRVFGTVAYYNEASLASYFDKSTSDMAALAKEMAQYFTGWQNFPAILAEYQADLLEYASNNARNFVSARCALILDKLKDVDEATAAEPIKNLIKTTKFFAKQLDRLKFSDTSVGAE
ncbi:glycoside hydrolase family 18 protein [Bipolaris oryzae ATCC 44560]|uniref:chitinase n=1 Tax=Bipolaris oryzae ATCC 44560 TaxID=930090 RepID=W6ZNG8_COCMI|nr:glycoside hydrolase family 18 protein [Bipolaris oryzae ATCC 44560]EUC49054.1 glycoside hydrolase family 18 protein [Bipolaris oryzae ATCC 44560]